ncbi:MAG TPA: outer membrane protein assembly factor BamA [Thermoanaerobaculia bacterium]|nr:outer membrane protein assembly factor BamA [Thermoanaerobaculia bacterium]
MPHPSDPIGERSGTGRQQAGARRSGQQGARLRRGRREQRASWPYRGLALGLLPLILIYLTGGLPLAAQPAPRASSDQPAPRASSDQSLAQPAPSQPPPVPPPTRLDVEGKKVAAIEFKGLKTLSEETLLYYLGIEIGQPVAQGKLNQNLKQLWDRGLVDDIRVDYAPATPPSAGLRLTITVQERPILRSIDYEGIKRVSKTDIQDKIATQRIKVHEGEPLSLGELQRVKLLIEDLYKDKGYRFAQARYTVQDLQGNEKKVTFSVDEGDRVRIAEIKFEGDSVFGSRRLRWTMRKTKQTNLVSRILKWDIYDPAKLQEDLDKVRSLYRGAGFKNVVIGDPRIEVRALNPSAAAAKDQKRRMFITIPLEEGDRWKFGEVSIDGNKIYRDTAILRLFSHKTGAWLSSKAIDDGVKKIEELYHNTGYIFAKVEPELVEKPNHVADLVVHINESDQFKVGRIEFAGNERTMDKVLRREVRLFEGGLVNIGAVRNSVLKINQLGYFKLEEEDPVDIDTNTEKKEVSLVFKGKEASRTELQFGGGWSQIDGFFGQFGVNTKNFLGRGEQLGLSVQVGARRNLYDLSYSIPWFLDRPQSIGLRVFDSALNYLALDSQYLQKDKGAVVTYGRNYGLFNAVSLSYAFSKRNDSATSNLSLPVADQLTEKFLIDTSSLKPAWIYDSRNDPFEPVRGQKFALSLEFAGGFLGGNNDFLRPDIGYSLFLPVTNQGLRTVFAVNGEAGWLHQTSSRPLSPLEFFFLGGENSIRGHRFRSITVRDSKGNPVLDAFGIGVGGNKYVQFNMEYHFLVGGPFRVLLFSDAASVYGLVNGHDQNINFSQLRYTAGVELRIVLPVFGAPLRFIYSKNLRPLPKDEFETFQFSIGTSF